MTRELWKNQTVQVEKPCRLMVSNLLSEFYPLIPQRSEILLIVSFFL
jgi:hypothetical protein